MKRVHEFKYLECLVKDKGTEKVDVKTSNKRRVTGAIKALVNEKNLGLECANVTQIYWFLSFLAADAPNSRFLNRMKI